MTFYGVCKECIANITCKPVTAACFHGSCEYCGSLDLVSIVVPWILWVLWFLGWFQRMADPNLLPLYDWRGAIPTMDHNRSIKFRNTHWHNWGICWFILRKAVHDFIAKQQSLYLTPRKELLLDNEYIVMTDFAENYSFVLQDAVQGFHWNNAQATGCCAGIPLE